MELKNGKIYVLQDLASKELEVVDDNVVRHVGMTRFASKKPTPFQKLLVEISLNNFKIRKDTLKHQAITLFSTTPLAKLGEMFSVNDNDIIDAYNDNSRRYFETALAKKILSSLPIDPPLLALIQDMTQFLTKEYVQSNYLKYLNEWKRAKQGTKPGRDALDYFSTLRPELARLLTEHHFLPSWKKKSGRWQENSVESETRSWAERKKLMLELYDLHYLTHGVSKLKTYQSAHPQGILEIYTNQNRYFKPENRGRINGFGFNLDNPSLHLGIFRSKDTTPRDMQKSSLLSAETRCPDRLYMEHPRIARKNKYNLQHHFFSNPYNSLYVNGLSGSMLLEVRHMIYYILSIKNGRHQLVNANLKKAFNPQLIKNYFLLMASLFVYFEGGHSFTEIFSVFQIEEVKSLLDECLGLNKLRQSVTSEIIESYYFSQCVQESLIDTAKFYVQSQNKENIHHHIETKGVHSIFT